MSWTAVVALAVILGLAGWAAFTAMGATRNPGDKSSYQPGGSGLVERVFFGLFGAPRDVDKEQATLRSVEKPPHVPRRTRSWWDRHRHK